MYLNGKRKFMMKKLRLFKCIIVAMAIITFFVGCSNYRGESEMPSNALPEDNSVENNIEEEEKAIQEFTDEDLSYAFYYEGEKKDYMRHDNISYIIYGEYSQYANSNKGMVYDLNNRKCYYTNIYGTQLASIYTMDDDSITVRNLSDEEIDTLINTLENNKLLEFPNELYAGGENKYGIEWHIGLIYEPGDFMSYSGSADFLSEKYNVEAVRESILGEYR